jgi:hypothetical protein
MATRRELPGQSSSSENTLLWDNAPYYRTGEGSPRLHAAHTSGQNSSSVKKDTSSGAEVKQAESTPAILIMKNREIFWGLSQF